LKVQPGPFSGVADDSDPLSPEGQGPAVEGPSPWVPTLDRTLSLVSSLRPKDAFVRAPKPPPPRVALPPGGVEAIARMSQESLAAAPLSEREAMIRAVVRRAARTPNPGGDDPGRERDDLNDAAVRILRTAQDPIAFGRLYFAAPPETLFDALDADLAKTVRGLYAGFLPTPGDWAGFTSYVDGVDDVRSSGGNALDFLIDGPQVIQSMLESIQGASSSICLSTYIWQGDDVGWQMARALADKADHGVPVRVLLDKYGTPPSGSKVAEQIAFMKAHGVEVRSTHVGLFGEHLNHRKILVVDGQLGFTGGMNVGRSELEWHDQMTRVQGPATAQLQEAFVDRWKASGGALSPEQESVLFPALTEVPTGFDTRVLADVGTSDRRIQAMYLRAIETAKDSIRIADPYLTDPDVVRALCDAARRHVKVQIIIPRINDVGIALGAARAYYPELIKAGVEVYEYKGRMAHEKVATMDGVFTTFGSANLDARSFRHNDEINCVVMDARFAAIVNAQLFDVDLQNAERITEHHPTLIELIDRMLSNYL